MYKKKIPFNIECGIMIAMEIMGGKWKACIIQELNNGSKRPSELHKLFEEASPRVINQQLRELLKHGVVEKKVYSEVPLHSEYSITEIGKSLLPVINCVEQWGDAFRPNMIEILEREEI